jgi:hypothetical protein
VDKWNLHEILYALYVLAYGYFGTRTFGLANTTYNACLAKAFLHEKRTTKGTPMNSVKKPSYKQVGTVSALQKRILDNLARHTERMENNPAYRMKNDKRIF